MRVLATDNDSGKEKGILTARSQAVLMEMYREGGYAWGRGLTIFAFKRHSPYKNNQRSPLLFNPKI